MLTETHYFLGANTPQGFYSLYDELYTGKGMLYILKGGAGCGKSSFMRAVAAGAESAEYIHCSGDPGSLDAVVLPCISIADGTAPHVLEPRYPAIGESYIDLGAYYDKCALAPLGQRAREITGRYKRRYAAAYRLLSAAGSVNDQLLAELETPEFLKKAEKRSRGIIQRELPRSGGGTGRVKRRFLSAITCEGVVSLLASVGAKRIFELSDASGLSHALLSPIAEAARARGLDAVHCLSPMRPDRLEHLLIPQLELAFLSSPPRAPFPHLPVRRLRVENMSDALRSERVKKLQKRVELLRGDAIAELAAAKALHDELEALYNPHVDFEGVYLRAKKLVAESV